MDMSSRCLGGDYILVDTYQNDHYEINMIRIYILLTFLYTCILGHAARYPFSIIPKTSHTRRFAITFSGWECWYCWYCLCLAEHTTRQSQSWDDEKNATRLGRWDTLWASLNIQTLYPWGFNGTHPKILGYELTIFSAMVIPACTLRRSFPMSRTNRLPQVSQHAGRGLKMP